MLRGASIALVLIGGALLRLTHASTAPITYLERYEYLPMAMTIDGGHLPLRMAQHGALPVYLVRASSLAFGDSLLGWRMTAVFAGIATILLLYLVAARWWSHRAGLIAAGLLAVERYHIVISASAIDLSFDLFFIAVAIYMFSRFLHALDANGTPETSAWWLYGTAAASGLGFLCKEITALLVMALLISLVLVGHASWLRRRQTWIAAAIFVLVVFPDVYASLTTTAAERLALWTQHQAAAARLGVNDFDAMYSKNGLFMSHGDQLSRFAGFGFNVEPFYFYFGDVLDAVTQHWNYYGAAPYMNAAMAGVLFLGVAVSIRQRRKDKLTVTLLTTFLFVMLVLASVRVRAPRDVFPTDPVALWYWADRTMLPAMLLTGHAIGRLSQRLPRLRRLPSLSFGRQR